MKYKSKHKINAVNPRAYSVFSADKFESFLITLRELIEKHEFKDVFSEGK